MKLVKILERRRRRLDGLDVGNPARPERLVDARLFQRVGEIFVVVLLHLFFALQIRDFGFRLIQLGGVGLDAVELFAQNFHPHRQG